MLSTPSCVSFSSSNRPNSNGPISETVARTGCPFSPKTSQNSTGHASPLKSVIPSSRARSTSSPAPGSSGASVTVVTRPASRKRSRSVTSGSRRYSGGCVPSRAGERNGPSRCAPITRGPLPSVGIARKASSSISSAAVMNVGWYAVTPTSSSASPARS